MKLKYYMRGLGIGIILTTLILAIGSRKEKLTDQEIIVRATELGMVMGDTDHSNLEHLLEDIHLTDGAPKPSEAVPSDKPADKPAVVPTEAAEQSSDVPTDQITPAPTEPVLPTVPPTDGQTDESDNDGQSGEEGGITFTIKRGMSSRMVSALLKEKGLIDNADEFNEYIERIGKASVIRVGVFTLPEGSSYDDIIWAITNDQ